MGSERRHSRSIAGAPRPHKEEMCSCLPATGHGAKGALGSAKGALEPVSLRKWPHSDGCGRPALPNASLQGQGQQGDFGRRWRCLEATTCLSCSVTLALPPLPLPFLLGARQSCGDQSPGGFAPGLSSFEGVNANRLLHPLAYASVPMPHASHNLLAKLYAVIQAMLSPVTAEGNRSVVCPRPCWKQADLCCIFTKAVSHLILKVTCNSCFSFPK